MDKTIYHTVNSECLGVKLKRFQSWFDQSDKEDVSDEEFVIPRKRKLKTEDVANKRIKPDAKSSTNLVLKIPKKHEPRPMLIKSTRKRPLAPAAPPSLQKSLRENNLRKALYIIVT